MGVLETNEIFKERLSRKAGMHQLTAQETEAIKKIILDITLDVVNLCDELGLTYMLGGGTALGAVRHKGFIPWDDDIDLLVPRADIDRLLDAVESRYPDKYYVEAPLRTPGYLSSFVQIHLKGTVFQEYRAQKEENCGIKIDIWVLENTYDNPIRRRWHGTKVQAWLFFLSCYRAFAWRKEFGELTSEDPAARRIMRVKKILGIPFAIAPRFFYRRTQLAMMQCKDDTSRFVTIPSGRKHFFGELYDRKAFMQRERMPFEGHELYISKDYDTYLTMLYGDYMTLPPEEKREHHVIYRLKFPGEWRAPRLLDRREVQLLLLDMLDALAAYCNKHGLRYYLAGGTLLGAVRHKGFIPWDDDIDVGMPRPDYLRFLELVKSEPVGERLEAVSGEMGSFDNPYCELLHMGTHLERGSSEYIRERCRTLHLFIDIFPVDGWPEGDKEAGKLYRRMKWYRYLIQCGRARIGKGVSFGRALAKLPMVLVMRVSGYRRIVKKMIRIAESYDYETSPCVGILTYGLYGPGERCPRDEMTDFTTVSFEGREYQAPGCWDRYLSQIYGDYMTPPPKDRRENHRLRVWLES